ncbi:MAG: amino acid adenylation domain-containing protein [Nitrospira sp.]|nr:amino acid adenylation domain-containing protein [Nitrospira sp.]
MSERRKESRTDVEGMYYLSSLQEGVLFHHLYDSKHDPYFCQTTYLIKGSVDINLFKQALQRVMQKHAVLRTSFVWEKVPRPIQVIHAGVQLPMDYEDWRSCADTERFVDLQEVLEADRQRGFEFRRPPLLKLRLIRLSEQEFYLVCNHHHILLDGWSVQLVLRKLFAFYANLRRFGTNREETVYPYRDYIVWLQRQDIVAAEQFWRQYLRGVSGPTVLPLEKPGDHSERPEFRYAEQEWVLTAAESERVRAFVRQHHLTVNTLVQGAWALLLQRYSNSTEVVFGSTVSGRPPDLEGADTMVGLFINTLPVRVQMNQRTPIVSWLQALQEQNSQVRQYEYTPLTKIQAWNELPSGQPLFETVVVAFDNFSITQQTEVFSHGFQIHELSSREAGTGYFLTKGRNNFPLSLVAGLGTTIQISFCYARVRWSHEAMTRLLMQYRHVVEWLLTHPQAQVAEVAVLTPEERRQVLIEWNPTAQEPVTTGCVQELIETQVCMQPERVAVVCEEERLTYAALNARANQVAHALRARGVGPGIRVGLCLERSVELLIGLLGILKAGGAYVPVEPTLPPERLMWVLQNAAVAGVLTPQAVAEETRTVLASIQVWEMASLLDEVIQPESDENLPAPAPENLAYLIYTSGSTGQPKGVAVSHQALVNYVSSVLARMAVPEAAMQWALLSTVAADLGHTMLFGALCAGRTLHLLSTDRGFHPEQMAEYMQREQIDVLKLTPSHLSGLLDATQPEQVLPRHCLVLGGEALQWTLVERIQTLAPDCAILNHYGPTEATVGALTHSLPSSAKPQGATVPIGRPLAHSRAYILDRNLELAPIGVPGELYLGGTGLAQGYHAQPRLTAERFVPDPFATEASGRLYRTGDQARYREDGTIEFLGRQDHQVKLRGYRIELGEIEAQLRQHPDVHEAVVVVRENRAEVKQLVAYVVAQLAHTVQPSALRASLARRLPDYMVPQAFVALEAFPLTRNGKLDRAALPDPEMLREPGALGDTAPQTEMEQLLAEIWADVLRRESVGRHDNFFELGGDSILSLQIIARAHRRGLKLTPKQLFEHSTVAGLASVAVVQRTDSVVSSNAPVMGTVPLTPIQHWFFEAQHPNPHHWNQAVLLEIRQSLNFTWLTQAVQALVAHHDVLRLRFHQNAGGQWMQTYAATESQLICERVDLAALAQKQLRPWPEVMEKVATEAHQKLHITHGPLIRVVYFDRGPDETSRLLLIIHHLVVDGVSWRILIEDLQLAYRQLEQGQLISLPAKSTSLKSWREHLGVYVESKSLQSELDYWTGDNATHTHFPCSMTEEANLVGNTVTVTVSLSAEETHSLLHDVPPVYRTEINDILLTALAQTLCEWSGQPSLRVELEGHGREDLFDGVDLSRTVGWFTTRFPVTLTPGNAGPGAAIQAVKSQLRRIPKKGIGYGILRYLNSDATTHETFLAAPPPLVTFNYLGQLDIPLEGESLFGIAMGSVGQSRDPHSRRSEVLSINASIVARRLTIDWTYPPCGPDAATMKCLAYRYMSDLRELLVHCGSPDAGGIVAGDFEDANLSDEELHDLLKEIG